MTAKPFLVAAAEHVYAMVMVAPAASGVFSEAIPLPTRGWRAAMMRTRPVTGRDRWQQRVPRFGYGGPHRPRGRSRRDLQRCSGSPPVAGRADSHNGSHDAGAG